VHGKGAARVERERGELDHALAAGAGALRERESEPVRLLGEVNVGDLDGGGIVGGYNLWFGYNFQYKWETLKNEKNVLGLFFFWFF
jgi:hypothetical protein